MGRHSLFYPWFEPFLRSNEAFDLSDLFEDFRLAGVEVHDGRFQPLLADRFEIVADLLA